MGAPIAVKGVAGRLISVARRLDLAVRQTPGLPFIGAALGALAAYVIIYLGSDRQEPPPFFGTTSFVVWLSLFCAQGALWVMVAAAAWTSFLRLVQGRQVHLLSWNMFLATALYLVAFFVPVFFAPNTEGTVPYFGQKVVFITVLAFLITWPGMAGSWLVAVDQTILRIGDPKDRITSYLQVRRYIDSATKMFGLMIGAIMLATGALRNAMIASGAVSPTEGFPEVQVLLYGLYFTALLALAYIPAQARLDAIGLEIRDRICPIATADADGWSTYRTALQSAEELLELNRSPWTVLQSAVTVLVPFAGSFVGLAVGKP